MKASFRLFASFCLLFVVCGPAAAVTIQSTSISTSASITGAGSDADGPASSGSLFSQVSDPNGFTADFGGDAFARGAIDTAGIGAVMAEGLYASPPGRIVLTSEATWSQTAEITGATPEELSLKLLITPAQLRIVDFAFVGVGVNENIASYAIDVTLNGSTVWSSGAELRGGRASHILTETGTDLGGTLGATGLVYDFDAFTADIALGTFAPGATLTVGYTMGVLVDTPQFETGGIARIGDPFSLSGGETLTLELVPEPSTAALVAVALLGLARGHRPSRSSQAGRRAS